MNGVDEEDLDRKAAKTIQFIFACMLEGRSYDPWDIVAHTGFTEKDAEQFVKEKLG